MLVSAVASASFSATRQQKWGPLSDTETRSFSAKVGRIVAAGRLQDAPKLHQGIQRILEGQYGLSREEAALYTLQIMTDALREAHSVVTADASIRLYREQQERVVSLDDPFSGETIADALLRKALDRAI